MKNVKKKPEDPPCQKCTALCCSYYAVQLDTPTSIEDFENFKWYIIHHNSAIFVDDSQWFLHVKSTCRFLLPNGFCGIYEIRPKICREYGWDDDKNVHCDFTTRDEEHDYYFSTPEEIDTYVKKRFPHSTRLPETVPSYEKLYIKNLNALRQNHAG